ncbi:storkhead-box protein 1 [Cricetulus griseus]|nr:storkhead-box protein 1 [Cricetulus griseus]
MPGKMEKFLQIAPHSLAIVLGPADSPAEEKPGAVQPSPPAPTQPRQLARHHIGYEIFADFKAENMQHFWNKKVTAAVAETFFLGWIDEQVLLIQGKEEHLEALREGWTRRALRPPSGFQIRCLVCLSVHLAQNNFSEHTRSLEDEARKTKGITRHFLKYIPRDGGNGAIRWRMSNEEEFGVDVFEGLPNSSKEMWMFDLQLLCSTHPLMSQPEQKCRKGRRYRCQMPKKFRKEKSGNKGSGVKCRALHNPEAGQPPKRAQVKVMGRGDGPSPTSPLMTSVWVFHLLAKRYHTCPDKPFTTTGECGNTAEQPGKESCLKVLMMSTTIDIYIFMTVILPAKS